ncbi:hypothetical protein ACVWZW_006311 [Bradyrhizobium sp. F1.13.4]
MRARSSLDNFFGAALRAAEARRGQVVNDIEHHAETAAGRQRDAVIVIVHGLAQHRKRLLGSLTQHGIGAHPRDLGHQPPRLGPIGAVRRPQAFECQFPGFKPFHHARNV